MQTETSAATVWNPTCWGIRRSRGALRSRRRRRAHEPRATLHLTTITAFDPPHDFLPATGRRAMLYESEIAAQRLVDGGHPARPVLQRGARGERAALATAAHGAVPDEHDAGVRRIPMDDDPGGGSAGVHGRARCGEPGAGHRAVCGVRGACDGIPQAQRLNVISFVDNGFVEPQHTRMPSYRRTHGASRSEPRRRYLWK